MKRWILSAALTLALLLLPLCAPAEGETGALFPAKGDNGLWGFIDQEGAFRIPPQYEKMSPWMGQYAAVTENGALWGIVDGRGNYALAPGEYLIDWLEDGFSHLFRVVSSENELLPEYAQTVGDQAAGFFDGDTGLFSGFQWKAVDFPRHGDMIPVMDRNENALWGYAERRTGKQAIPCQFANAGDFYGDWAVADLPVWDEYDLETVAVNRDGLILHAPKGCSIAFYSVPKEGLVAILDEKEDRDGYMNLDGEIVIPPRYLDAFPFEGNYAVVEDPEGWETGYWFYIDRQGNQVPGVTARPEGNGGTEFVNGITSVFVDGKPGAMDEKGNVVFVMEGEELFWLWNFMDNGLAWYMEWHPEAGSGWYEQQFYGLADAEGNRVTGSVFQCVAEEGSPFSEGLAAVSRPDMGLDPAADMGYIDETGNWAIEPRFYSAGKFENGLAFVTYKDGRCGYVDREGNEVYFWNCGEKSAWWEVLPR